MIITDRAFGNRCQSSCLLHSDWVFQANGKTLQGYQIMFYGYYLRYSGKCTIFVGMTLAASRASISGICNHKSFHFPDMQRNSRIDSLKYWLMILVIAGHVFPKFRDSGICMVLYKWIFIFHMPLFIFISGYFSRKKSGKEFWASSWKILEPLIIFHLIGCALFDSGPFTIASLLTPWYVLWYLLSLFFWRLMLQIIPDTILSHVRLVMICSCVIGIAAGFMPFDKCLSLQRTLAFVPFFFAGYYMRGKHLFLPDKYKPLCVLFLVATFIVPIFFPSCLGDLKRANPYDGIVDMYDRVFTFGLSIPMSVAFMNICPNFAWTAQQGRYTMQYYIYHAFMITILMAFAEKMGWAASFPLAMIYFVLIVAVLGISSYLPFFSKSANPISELRKHTPSQK